MDLLPLQYRCFSQKWSNDKSTRGVKNGTVLLLCVKHSFLSLSLAVYKMVLKEPITGDQFNPEI